MCYAKFGYVGIVTSRLDKAGMKCDASALEVAKAEALAIDALTSGLPLRLHVVGDCRTNATAKIVAKAAVNYSKRKKNAPVWTYTHAHREVSRESWGAVSVLASCESLHDAKEAMGRGYAAAVVTGPHHANGKAYKDAATGLRVIPCPSQVGDTTCADCKLCWNDKNLLTTKSVIGFEAHGVKKKALLNILEA
jgi:hypothetical protein